MDILIRQWGNRNLIGWNYKVPMKVAFHLEIGGDKNKKSNKNRATQYQT